MARSDIAIPPASHNSAPRRVPDNDNTVLFSRKVFLRIVIITIDKMPVVMYIPT